MQKRKEWTKEEEAYLWAEMTENPDMQKNRIAEAVAVVLERPIGSVRTKMSRLQAKPKADFAEPVESGESNRAEVAIGSISAEVVQIAEKLSALSEQLRSLTVELQPMEKWVIDTLAIKDKLTVYQVDRHGIVHINNCTRKKAGEE